VNRVLIVEDHERLSELIARQLRAVGIESDVFSRIEEAKGAIRLLEFNAIVLDRALPDGDGLSFLQGIRKAGHSIPCIMLTAKDALHDRLEGLDIGADDYLTKPFSMEELIARVRALLRRPVTTIDEEAHFEDITIKPNTSEMYCGSRRLVLPSSELQIMLYLVRKQGAIVRHVSLDNAAWGLGEAVTPNALNVVLHRLRKKLSIIGSQLFIENNRNLGYSLRKRDDEKK
tara:strand:+ start:4690 stop:5379 length:690 start_codon:yes stop_codon:yes gene_type:complete